MNRSLRLIDVAIVVVISLVVGFAQPYVAPTLGPVERAVVMIALSIGGVALWTGLRWAALRPRRAADAAGKR